MAVADGPEKVFEMENKQRIIQEFVPGKQVTLAHIIANPNPDIYKKLGVIGDHMGAIIGADVATKAANVEVIFVDRFNGSLVIGGDVASVETGVRNVLDVLHSLLKFAPTEITRT